ncbi:MAG: hypothetical protein Hyperionvirus47_1, partial [Hyperionvirus sp.]
LVFISFLTNENKGFMFEKLQASGQEPKQFRFSGNHPDLTKIDKLLAELSYIDKSTVFI